MTKVAVILADGFEEIEALTVVDLLRRAQLYVDTVSIQDDYMVHGSHGITVQTEDMFDEVNFADIDVIVLPGGKVGTENLKADEGVRREVTSFINDNKMVAAICAAPTILADLGFVKGKRITCHPTVEMEIQGAGGVLTRLPATVDGNIVTGQAAGSAMEFALKLIEILVDKDKSEEIAGNIVY